MKRLILGLTSAALLAGCGQAALSTRAAAPASAVQAQGKTQEAAVLAPAYSLPRLELGGEATDENLTLTPEKAEDKARERAIAWAPDADLRFVAWGVAKWEPLSVVNHVFYSPSKNEVLAVTTFLDDKWQRADAFDQKPVTAPAKFLQPLASNYHINGHYALGLARRHFFFSHHPLTLLTLTQPPKLPFAFWGAIGDATVVLIHAQTGQSLSPRLVDPFPKEWVRN